MSVRMPHPELGWGINSAVKQSVLRCEGYRVVAVPLAAVRGDRRVVDAGGGVGVGRGCGCWAEMWVLGGARRGVWGAAGAG